MHSIRISYKYTVLPGAWEESGEKAVQAGTRDVLDLEPRDDVDHDLYPRNGHRRSNFDFCSGSRRWQSRDIGHRLRLTVN